MIPECDDVNATFNSLNTTWLFPINPDTNTYDYCKPYEMVSDPDHEINFDCQADDFLNKTYDFIVNNCSRKRFTQSLKTTVLVV